MRALTVQPERANSAQLIDMPEPSVGDGTVLVQTLAIGICGTDTEIVQGHYGAPPPGQASLVLGHESLGRVIEAPGESGLLAGDLVVGIVRRPDPVPCSSCAVGEWDMCRNGRYTESGIKHLDGFCADRFRIMPQYAVPIAPHLHRVGVLVEPASVVAKAWEHIERIGQRAHWAPQRVLVTGAGPVGLLAALMGIQRGFAVNVLDRLTYGPKPSLVQDLGAKYHTGDIREACADADIVLECTGVGQLVFDVVQNTPPGGIVCLTGLSSGGRLLEVNLAELNRRMVLENDVVFGSVNANRRHYEAAADALARADLNWLERLITRRVPLPRWQAVLDREPTTDVKAVLDWTL